MYSCLMVEDRLVCRLLISHHIDSLVGTIFRTSLQPTVTFILVTIKAVCTFSAPNEGHRLGRQCTKLVMQTVQCVVVKLLVRRRLFVAYVTFGVSNPGEPIVVPQAQ